MTRFIEQFLQPFNVRYNFDTATYRGPVVIDIECGNGLIYVAKASEDVQVMEALRRLYVWRGAVPRHGFGLSVITGEAFGLSEETVLARLEALTADGKVKVEDAMCGVRVWRMTNEHGWGHVPRPGVSE